MTAYDPDDYAWDPEPPDVDDHDTMIDEQDDLYERSAYDE